MSDFFDEEEPCRDSWFAIMWDNHGLEAVETLPDPAYVTWAKLQGQEPPRMPNLKMWELRARYNPQRHYEIYLIMAKGGITKDDIVQMFNSGPQTAADTIRRIGQKFYSDRADKSRVVIT